MTVWERYSQDERDSYEEYLKMYGTLSALFNQKSSETGAPYLDSKFQETIYARSFNSEEVDISNTPHDIRSEFGNEKIGIGLKTWLNSKPSYQKVMQLKSYRDELDPYINNQDAEGLTNLLARIKNKKLIVDYKRLGLKDNVNIYHYVTRDKGRLVLSETSYPLVDLTHLKPGKMTKTSLEFSDGDKQYKFTYSDHEIWMRFGPEESNTIKLDELPVNILDDPFSFLHQAFHNFYKEGQLYVPQSVTKKIDEDKYLYLPLYSYRSKNVEKGSGLNAWNGLPKTKGSTTVRPEGEAYIPIPKKLWDYKPHWVDPSIDMSNYKEYRQKSGESSVRIKLHMPDGTIFEALFGQSDFKALETKPQSILGKWILNVLGIKHPQREQYNQPADNIVTMKLLREVGFDSVKLWHENPDKPRDIWIDFAEYGAFERYMNYLKDKNKK